MNINDITPRRLNKLSPAKMVNQTNEAAPRSNQIWTGNKPAATLPTIPAAATAAAKPLPTTPAAPVAAATAAAKPLPTTPAAPVAAAPVAAAPVDPVQQKSDQMQQSLLDRMGKRFGLPPGSSQEQVQAAQQEYLNKNDPAAAAQYQQNMANIEAGGTQAANKPVQLAPTAAPAKPQQSADWQAGLAAQKAGGSPIAMMLAQPTIAGNQAMLDNIAKTLGLPAGSTAAEISAADAKQPSVKQQGIDSLAADQGYAAGTSVEQMAVDNIAKMAGLPAGMTKDEMLAAYAKKTQAAGAAVPSAPPVAEGSKKPQEADYGDDYQDMVARVKKLAGLGPLKTVWDPTKRVYRNVPTAVQPKK